MITYHTLLIVIIIIIIYYYFHTFSKQRKEKITKIAHFIWTIIDTVSVLTLNSNLIVYQKFLN